MNIPYVETVSEVVERRCPFHEKYPHIKLKWDCACSITFFSRAATPEEIKEKRERQHKEDEERSKAMQEFGFPSESQAT